jgi:hypothetical protein
LNGIPEGIHRVPGTKSHSRTMILQKSAAGSFAGAVAGHRPTSSGFRVRGKQVAEAYPAQKLGADPIQDRIDDCRSVLSGIDVDSKGSLAEGCIDDFYDCLSRSRSPRGYRRVRERHNQPGFHRRRRPHLEAQERRRRGGGWPLVRRGFRRGIDHQSLNRAFLRLHLEAEFAIVQSAASGEKSTVKSNSPSSPVLSITS